MMQPVARYREFDPCPSLRDFVHAFFAFTVPAEPDQPRRPVRCERLFHAFEAYTTPLFADSQVCLSFSFGAGYRVDGLWNQARERHCGHVIGAMSRARPAAHGDCLVQVGVYFRPVRARCFFALPACELTDRILSLADLWGAVGGSLEARLAEAKNDEQRVNHLEDALLERLRFDTGHRSSVDLPALAAFVQTRHGDVNVSELARTAGVSRQHLGRLFQEEVGMQPKLFCRLARFRGALACAGRKVNDGGAALAAKLGYVDQSHMIAEFREFSGLTPRPILLHERVHPFMYLVGEAGMEAGRIRENKELS